MATRSGAGTGVVVGLVVFVLLSVSLLVTTIVFYSKSNTAQEERLRAEAALDEYATRNQRASDRFMAIKSTAAAGGQSVVGHLLDQQGATMSSVLGSPGATVDDLNNRLQPFAAGAPNATYIEVLGRMNSDIRQARNEADSLRQQMQERDRLLAERDAMLQQYERDKDAEVQAVRDLIATFASDVQRYGTDVDEAKRAMVRALRDLETRFDAQVEQQDRTIDNLRADLAMRDTQLAQVQNIINQLRIKMQRPELLVDARVLDNANTEGQVFIDRGKADRITLGMTFEVYDNAAQLANIGLDGDLPRGKASLQVLTVGQTTSTARITRSTPGRPVVRGDVLANAVYDPNKTFLFLVHGMFDLDGDGRPSSHETDRVRSLVREWGGEIVDGAQVRGDLDFVVLGVQPTRPMDLPDNPTPEQLRVWVEMNQAFQTYNEILRDAQRASIPVLNQNRFLILIGHTYN